jgi:DNA-binding MarR family transcriptional regulator
MGAMNPTPDAGADDRQAPLRTGRLSFAVFELARTHRAYAGELLRDLGLYPGQELLLMQLLQRDGQSQSELLAAVGLDHSTVSRSLKRMQEAGLLHREPAEHDRRAMRVWLTDQGKAMRGPLEEMWTALEEASIRNLDKRAIEDFIATAGAIRQSIVDHHETPHRPADSPRVT